MDPWARPRQFLPGGQACPSIFPHLPVRTRLIERLCCSWCPATDCIRGLKVGSARLSRDQAGLSRFFYGIFRMTRGREILNCLSQQEGSIDWPRRWMEIWLSHYRLTRSAVRTRITRTTRFSPHHDRKDSVHSAKSVYISSRIWILGKPCGWRITAYAFHRSLGILTKGKCSLIQR